MSFRHVVLGSGILGLVVACSSTDQGSDDSSEAGGYVNSFASGAPGSGGDTSFGTGGTLAGSGGTTASGGTFGSGGTSVIVGSGGSGAGSGGLGGAESGGSNAGGAVTDAGMRPETGAANADAAAPDGGNGCPSGQKRCQSDSQCRDAIPINGCDLGGACTPCPAAPANGYTMCSGEMCDFDCLSGFQRDAAGTGCESATGAGGRGGLGSGGRGGGRGGRNGSGGASGGAAGSSGAGGAGGSSSQCEAKSCPDCSNALQRPCCRSDDTCGCGLLGGLFCK